MEGGGLSTLVEQSAGGKSLRTQAKGGVWTMHFGCKTAGAASVLCFLALPGKTTKPHLNLYMIRPLLATACTLLLAMGLRADDVKEVVLHPDNANPLAYDAASKTFTVKAGQKVHLTVKNNETVVAEREMWL